MIKNMQYKLTRQYARDIEKKLAGFVGFSDARFFLKAKLSADMLFNVTAIYRLWDGDKLLEESNRGNINVAGVPARYFLEDDLQGEFTYSVFSQDLNSAPVCCAGFVEMGDAQLFANEKITADALAKKRITYRIFKSSQLVEKLDPKTETTASEKEQQSADQGSNGGTSGMGRRSAFHPTPYNTTPRPAAYPRGWIQEEKVKGGEKEKEKES